MRTRATILLTCIFIVAFPAFAHAGLQHVMGTVKSISATSITVETAGTTSKEVTVALLPATTFQKDGVSTTAKELKVGDRVVIHARAEGDGLNAVTVAFGKIPAHSDKGSQQP
jgi:hypothetical protein